MFSKSELLQFFVLNYPELMNAMRSVDHAYSTNDVNPYHIEGDVWSHTMMVLNAMKTSNPTNMLSMAGAICALTHDIGKIHTRKSIDENRYVSFYSHSYASVQYACDLIFYLNSMGYISEKEKNFFLTMCLPVVSNHIEVMNNKIESIEDFRAYTNYSYGIARLTVMLMRADLEGRFCVSPERDSSYRINNLCSYFDIYELGLNGSVDSPITMFCGVPGSGKDYLASKIPNSEVVSFDEIRKVLFMQEFPTFNKDSLSPTEFYNIVWNWCGSKKIDIMPEFMRAIKRVLSDGKRVCIANTNCGKRGRRSVMNSIKNEFKSIEVAAKYIVTTSSTYHERNLLRVNDKCLPTEVVDKFARNQQIPTCLEGFSSVEIVAN